MKNKKHAMNYTYQTITESGCFSAPDGNDVEHATNKRQLVRALELWKDSHDRVGADESMAELQVWKGTLDDITDVYPDFVVKSGPRGGVIFENC